MCVSIGTEKAAANYIREYLRAGGDYYTRYAKDMLVASQRANNWLTDHEIVDGKLQLKAKPVTGKPGMEVVREALRESDKTAPTPEKKPARKRAKATA